MNLLLEDAVEGAKEGAEEDDEQWVLDLAMLEEEPLLEETSGPRAAECETALPRLDERCLCDDEYLELTKEWLDGPERLAKGPTEESELLPETEGIWKERKGLILKVMASGCLWMLLDPGSPVSNW